MIKNGASKWSAFFQIFFLSWPPFGLRFGSKPGSGPAKIQALEGKRLLPSEKTKQAIELLTLSKQTRRQNRSQDAFETPSQLPK